MGKIRQFPRKHTTQKNKSKESSIKKKISVNKKVISGIAIITIAYFGFLLIDQSISYFELLQQKKQIQEEINEAKEDKKELEEKVELLNDLDYIEILARRKFGFIREGEVPLDVLGDDTN
ncbi:septum formation initiator family protein [Natranaerobius trueperi]|uniref:Septum formation initiator n=1 Tax=Natranaerobius trueperi TaxID=759412 RepID=A0A226BUM2_9FIRM|nr:septum formation initiator family protein [Natranaerobius trueperi]OWZ82696.1 hypothetical protein CDO51_12670 [Natranaerobius trueperi]